MENEDIKLIRKLLVTQKRKDLSDFLTGSTGEIEQTGQFGSYWNSVISYYNIHLPLDSFVKSKTISSEDKKMILDAVLDLHPHGDGGVEIQGVFFYIQREDTNNEIPSSEKTDMELGECIEFETKIETQYKFLNEQLNKSQKLFDEGDFAGVLTCIRSSVEAATFDIFKRITGEEIYGTGSLGDDYKKVRKLLNLAPENETSSHAKKLTSSLVSIIDAIDQLSNQMGDRHIQKVIPERHHALLCLNAGRSIISFLYSSLIYQYNTKNTLYKEITDCLYEGSNRTEDRATLLEKPKLKFIFNRCDEFTKGLIKKKLISEFEINHFKDSDVFFKALELLGNINKKEDVTLVENKCSGNGQACGLKNFLITHNQLIL
ncbi:MAG: abortive infection family protein [bacterium]